MSFLLVGSGFRAAYPPLIAALIITAAFPDGTISQIGPFPLQPELRVLITVPILCALATAISHNMTGSRVIPHSARVHLLRLLSILLAATVSGSILAAGTYLGGLEVGGALLRNYLWLSGVAMATSALFGVVYAWFPLMGAFGLALVFPADTSDWSLYGFLFRETATFAQVGVAAALFMVGAGLLVANPRHHGYLPGRRRRHRSRPTT